MTDQKDKIIEILTRELYKRYGVNPNEKIVRDDVRSLITGRYRNAQILQMIGFKWEPLPKPPTIHKDRS